LRKTQIVLCSSDLPLNLQGGRLRVKEQQYKALFDAAFRGNNSRARLGNILVAIRDAFFENDAVSIWVTNDKDDPLSSALFHLTSDSVNFQHEDRAGNAVRLADRAAFTTEIEVASTTGPETIGYLHFSVKPVVPKNELRILTDLIGRELLEFKREITGEILYSILESYRKGIFQTNKLIGQKELDDLGEEIGRAFSSQPVLFLYSLQSWRQNAGPIFSSRVNWPLAETSDANFFKGLHNEICTCLESNPANEFDDKIACEIRPFGKFKKRRNALYYVVAQPLAHPSAYGDAGIPYIALVFRTETGHSLNHIEMEFLDKFLKDFQRILRVRDEFKLMSGMYDLIQVFPLFSSTIAVADSVAKYLDNSFNASEVAILERRGNFLSIIAKDSDVNLRDVPPLHIPTTTALVCEVAKTRVPSYIPDVSAIDTYLPVVASTKTQFTVPLIWQGDLVGVLLVGLAVVDGFQERHKEIIEILGGFCAAALTVSRRTTEEHAIRYQLGEVLTGAALKINSVVQSNDLTPGNRSKLKTAFDLLHQFQQFIERLNIVQRSIGPEEYVDLRAVIDQVSESPYLESWLKQHPEHLIVTLPFDEPMIAHAHAEGVLIALHNIVLNGLEAMEGTPGEVTISAAIKGVTYKAGTEPVLYGVISVIDRGTGIPLSEQVKIFDLFSGTKPNHLGSGLNIAKCFVEGFGGKIDVQTEPDNGSEFSLWIPIRHNEAL
jgi:GAF domain-containing protein